MIISSQGFGHFTKGLNNQDFGIETPRMLLVLDGCSGAKYSEVGTRLFAQLLLRKEDFDNYEKFEENVKSIFEKIIKKVKEDYPNRDELEKDFIMENLLFTIIACFKTTDKYIVKLFGDGYIVSQNKKGQISYMRYSYGQCPPYFAYKYCSGEEFECYKKANFKTFEFDRNVFHKIGIGSDGIMPMAKGEIRGFDSFIVANNNVMIESAIRNNRQSFFDDVTFAFFNEDTETC